MAAIAIKNWTAGFGYDFAVEVQGVWVARQRYAYRVTGRERPRNNLQQDAFFARLGRSASIYPRDELQGFAVPCRAQQFPVCSGEMNDHLSWDRHQTPPANDIEIDVVGPSPQRETHFVWKALGFRVIG